MRIPLVPTVLVGGALLGTVLLGACSNDNPNGEPAPAASPTPTQGSGGTNQPTVEVKASATGEGGDAALKRASETATGELETFFGRYLTTALTMPAGENSARELTALFDEPIRGQVADDLASLSLLEAGDQITGVRAQPATATASLLVTDGRARVATVRLELDGTALTAQQQVPISLRSTFQLLRGGEGWRIVAYDSEAKVP